MWYNIDNKKSSMNYRLTLRQGKTHCGRRLITDPIVHVVTDADLKQNQPSGTESIEMHVSLMSKYGSRVLLATHTGYSFGLHRYLIKKSDQNDKLLSTKATFGFY